MACVLAVALVGCADDALGPSVPELPTLEERLDALLTASTDEALPGLALKVIGPGVEYTGTDGLAEVASATPWTADQVTHVASVGKAFIGTAAARLALRGSLDLDAPIGTWLSPAITERIPSSDAITMRHLLQHTSGIVDVLNDMLDAVYAIYTSPGRVWTDADLVQFALDKPLHFEPGASWRYSNTNFMLAGLILEHVTGLDHAALLRDLVFDPLGMLDTRTANEGALATAPVHGYWMDEGQMVDGTPWALTWEASSGGQWTTVDDLTRFLLGVFETDALGGDALRTVLLETSGLAPYGLGVLAVETPHGLMLGHNGEVFGYSAYVGYFPENRTAVVLCANGEDVDESGSAKVYGIFEGVLDEVFGG
jgi:D-alanyl-D-alanine carboxypeptidase